MKGPSMESSLLCWLRFSRRYPYACTEATVAGFRRADVLALDPERDSVEVEVKRSWNDYRADLEKSSKHGLYKSEGLRNGAKPNRMFYAAEPGLAARIAADLEATGSPYGVLAVDSRFSMVAGRNVQVLRKARPLHKDRPSAKMVLETAMRMSSELANLRLGGKTEAPTPELPECLEPLGD